MVTQLMLHVLYITSKHNEVRCKSREKAFVRKTFFFWRRRAPRCSEAQVKRESSKLIPFTFVSFPDSGMLIALGGSVLRELKEVTLPHLPAMTAEKTERTSVLTVKCQRGEGTEGTEGTEGSRPGKSHLKH